MGVAEGAGLGGVRAGVAAGVGGAEGGSILAASLMPRCVPVSRNDRDGHAASKVKNFSRSDEN